MSDQIEKPVFVLGPLRATLYAYRITNLPGFFFVEETTEGEPDTRVHYTSAGFIMNAAGESYRDEYLGKLLARNALAAVEESHELAE